MSSDFGQKKHEHLLSVKLSKNKSYNFLVAHKITMMSSVCIGEGEESRREERERKKTIFSKIG